MKYFSDNSDYYAALQERIRKEHKDRSNPITYRMLHEDVAGMGLCDEFFSLAKIDPDAKVKCNCVWNDGHEATCNLVAANELRRRLKI